MSWLDRLLISAALLLCLFSAGCVEGPFGGFAPINPVIQRKWAEDEKFGPTFHRRLADLRGLREGAARLDPQKKEEMAAEMSKLLATEQNSVLRAEIVRVLGELAIPSALPGLNVAIGDSDKDVRIAACRGWGKAGPSSVPVLADVLGREADIDVRLAAISELGKYQDQAAVAALGSALDDPNPAVQHLAVQSLKSSTGKDLGDSVPAWRDFVQGRQPASQPSPSIVERITNWF